MIRIHPACLSRTSHVPGFYFRQLQVNYLQLNVPYIIDVAQDGNLLRLNNINSGTYFIACGDKPLVYDSGDLISDNVAPPKTLRYRRWDSGQYKFYIKHLTDADYDTLAGAMQVSLQGQRWQAYEFFMHAQSDCYLSFFRTEVPIERVKNMRVIQYGLLNLPLE